MAPAERSPRPTDEELEALGEISERASERDVDVRAAALQGEASRQAVADDRAHAEGSPRYDVWTRPAADTATHEAGVSYYDRPLLKQPTWIWTVPSYFFAGSVAGGAAVLAAAAQASDRSDLEGLIRRARWVSAIAGGVGTGLLVADLGRPERFLNMLRVFRPSSPMSIGSWSLAGAASLTAGSAVLDVPGSPLRSVGDLLGLGAGAAALPLSTYTAVLLSNTAVPVWQEVRRSLPALFASSAVASAASVLDLFGATERESRILRAYGLAGRVAELIAARAVERDAASIARVARPLHEGVSGALWRASEVLNVASIGLLLAPTARRAPRVAAALAGIASGVALRFAVMRAGTASSLDPRASFRQQREGSDRRAP